MAPDGRCSRARTASAAGADRRLARAGRPRAALPPRHEPRGESRTGRATHEHALRRRPGDPPPPGDRARRRRRARAQALGLEPSVFHMNEGHSAFLPLERMRELRRARTASAADEALERLRAATVFTTHTPVPAGNDGFDAELVRRNFGPSSSAAGSRGTSSWLSGRSTPTRMLFGSTPFACGRRDYATASPSCTARVARDVARPWPDRPATRCRSRRSRTASTCRRGSARRARRRCSARRSRLTSSSRSRPSRPRSSGRAHREREAPAPRVIATYARHRRRAGSGRR